MGGGGGVMPFGTLVMPLSPKHHYLYIYIVTSYLTYISGICQDFTYSHFKGDNNSMGVNTVLKLSLNSGLCVIIQINSHIINTV